MSWGTILMPTLGLALIAQACAVRAGRSRTLYFIYRTDAPPGGRRRLTL
jgi:hypothetical protein